MKQVALAGFVTLALPAFAAAARADTLDVGDGVKIWYSIKGHGGGAPIHGTTAGLEPWQWYGPSTTASASTGGTTGGTTAGATAGATAGGDRTYLFAVARPYDSVTVRGVQVHGARQTEAVAGQRSAVNLSGVDVEDLERGHTLVSPGAFEPTRAADAPHATLSLVLFPVPYHNAPHRSDRL